MIKKSIIQKISDKEMDRKDFLKYSGLVLVSAIGLKGVAALLTQIEKGPAFADSTDQKPRGFGSGRYGV